MSLEALLSPRGYAHRGLHDVGAGVVENSPSAVQAAIDAGVGIEIDVQMSADRVPMVFHDEILSRLAGRDGRLAFMKAHELETIPYRHGTDKIMTLETCLEMVAGHVPLLIEVKSHWHGKPQMEVQLAALLKDYEGAFGVMSFDPEVIERVRGVGLKAPIGLITEKCPPKDWPLLSETERHRGAVQFERAKAIGVDFIAHQVGDLFNPFLQTLLSELSCPLFGWTADSAARVEAARKAGAVPIFEGDAAAVLVPSSG